MDVAALQRTRCCSSCCVHVAAEPTHAGLQPNRACAVAALDATGPSCAVSILAAHSCAGCCSSRRCVEAHVARLAAAAAVQLCRVLLQCRVLKLLLVWFINLQGHRQGAVTGRSAKHLGLVPALCCASLPLPPAMCLSPPPSRALATNANKLNPAGNDVRQHDKTEPFILKPTCLKDRCVRCSSLDRSSRSSGLGGAPLSFRCSCLRALQVRSPAEGRLDQPWIAGPWVVTT